MVERVGRDGESLFVVSFPNAKRITKQKATGMRQPLEVPLASIKCH
jgi:hypothetical protein